MSIKSINICLTEYIGELLEQKFETTEQIKDYATWCVYSTLLGEMLRNNTVEREKPSIFDFDNE